MDILQRDIHTLPWIYYREIYLHYHRYTAERYTYITIDILQRDIHTLP